jgi:hypothetical protein
MSILGVEIPCKACCAVHSSQLGPADLRSGLRGGPLDY